MELHEKLRRIRETIGLTRTEVEKKTGISYSCIKELENGISNPTLFTLEVLCDYYGVDLWWVLKLDYDSCQNEIMKLRELAENGDNPEENHSDADDCLCDILIKLGMHEAVKYYNNIYKWYS